MPTAPSCNINLSSLFPSCEAFKSVAGVRDFGYFCRRIDITGVARANDGTVTSVAITTGKLKKFQTQKFQNGADQALESSDIRKTRFKQTYRQRIYARSQGDRNAIEQLCLAPDVVQFSPNNDNQIEIYGLNLGLEATGLAWSTGTKLGDDNTALVTFEGSESSLAPLYNTVSSPLTATSSSSATSASTALAVVSAAGIVVGQGISGTGVPTGTTVVSISSNTLTLSAPATVAASTALTLTSNDESDFLANIAVLDALVGA